MEAAVHYLQMRGITKIYRETGLKANDGVSLDVEKKEIHALVGENGAGKTTLMRVLYGLEKPEAGEIFLEGKKADISGPQDANRLGIGMVHQHFTLIPDFTVAENVVLGTEPLRYGILFDREAAEEQVSRIIADHAFHIDPATRVRDCTVGQMQQVEIIKMLYRKADLLILDEPTSILTEQETKKLFENLRILVDKGKTCILITHKLTEVMAVSDRITVMRKGRVVARRKTSETDSTELSRLMVGKEILFDIEKPEASIGRNILELKDVTLVKRRQDRPLLDHVNISVEAGQITGIAGIGGNGLGELEDVVTGLRMIHSGSVVLDGRDVTNIGAAALRKLGLSYIPADRLFRGSSLSSSVRENMIVTCPGRFSRAGVLRGREIRAYADKLASRFDIDGTPDVPIGTLSGGNIQKVILSRETNTRSDCIVFSEPTWGLDVASSDFLYRRILDIRAGGSGVLLISSNLDEILVLSDRIIVLYRGRVVADLENNGLSKELIGEYMLGLKNDFPYAMETTESP